MPFSEEHGVLALPNCTYSLGNNLAWVAPTTATSNLFNAYDDGLICHQRLDDFLTLETNQVTIRLANPSRVRVTVKGQVLPHLVGNCKQDPDADNDLWLQMGESNCIKMQRQPSKSWIKAQQFCQEHEGHLLSLHNDLDEKFVQNLVFNR